VEQLAILRGRKKVTIPFPHFIWPEVNEIEINAVEDYMRNGKIGRHGYPEVVEEFERRFKKYHGVSFALALNSGTSCLHAAYYALGIKTGDEVIAPNITFPATATPIFVLGAVPVLCDCLRDTANIDPVEIERKITSRTKAIVVTHLWGHPCEMDEIMAISKRHDLPVIEDCSHSHGARYKSRLVGTFGAVSCFSCDNQKMLASGEAGVMITNSREIFEKSLIFTDFGSRVRLQLKLPQFKKFRETGLGLKYRIHPLAAVIANEKLKRLDAMNAEKVQTLNYFSKRLKETNSIIPPVTKDYAERGGFYGYKPIYDSRNLKGLDIKLFIKILQKEGVDVRQNVTPPLHLTELFSNPKNYGVSTNTACHLNIKYKSQDFKNSVWFLKNHLSFPTFSKASDRKIIDQYIDAIHKAERIIIDKPEIINKIEKKWRNF